MITDGQRLYSIVREYASIAHHRTGTEEDRQTRAWLCDQLVSLGARPRQVAYAFPQFVVDQHVVTLNGAEVESVPLWYAGEGEYETDFVLRHEAPFQGGEMGDDPSGLEHPVDASPRRPAVVATTGLDGRLGVPNRAPSTSIERPHALVPGHLANVIEGVDVHYASRLRRRVGESANVFASFGDTAPDPVVVTTPISGWFACAGERGTGLAIALDLAAELAADHPVLFIGTTGHEVGYLGVETLLAAELLDQPRAVIHIGASVAAGDGQSDEVAFFPERYAFTTMTGSGVDELAAVAAAAAYRVADNPTSWRGEGEVLKQLGAPMLSFLGSFPFFHTSADIPELATSPRLLELARDAVVGGVSVLLGSLETDASIALVG